MCQNYQTANIIWVTFKYAAGDNSVGVVTRLQAGRSGVRLPAGETNFYLLENSHTGSGAHPVCYSMGTRGSFPGNKAAVAWSWPLTTILCQHTSCVFHGTYRDNFTFHVLRTLTFHVNELKRNMYTNLCTHHKICVSTEAIIFDAILIQHSTFFFLIQYTPCM